MSYTTEQLADMVVRHVERKEKERDLQVFKQELLHAFHDPEHGDWVYGVYHHAVRNLPANEIQRLQKTSHLCVAPQKKT